MIKINEFLKIVPAVRNAPFKYFWSSYDADADVVYINFKKLSHVTDSEMIDDDVVVRYENGDPRLSHPSGLPVYLGP